MNIYYLNKHYDNNYTLFSPPEDSQYTTTICLFTFIIIIIIIAFKKIYVTEQ